MHFVITNAFRPDNAHFGGKAKDNEQFCDRMEYRFFEGEDKMKCVPDDDDDDNDRARCSILKVCSYRRITVTPLVTHFPCLAAHACFLQKYLFGACHILTLH